VSNVKTFLIGFILVAAGGTLFGFMLANESWMVAEDEFENGEYVVYKPGTTGRMESGIYGWEYVEEGEYCTVEGTFFGAEVIECGLPMNKEESYSYGDDDENNAILMGCKNGVPDAEPTMKSCRIIAAGDTAHWIFLGGIILASLAIILAFIAIPGYIPGWIISLLMVLAVLTIATGAVVWLVMYPEVNDDIENPDEHFSPSYGFYLTLASTPLLFLGGIAWGGMEAYALGNDDWEEDEEEWRDAMESSNDGDANWRQQQNRPTMIPDTRELQQQQYQQEIQQYQYQDQGYHNQQSYAQPQRQAPSSPSPTSRPPFGGAPSAPPNAGPPQASVGPPRSGPSGPSGMGGPPRSGPPAGPSMSPKPKGPPRSESSSSPRVRKAIAPIPNPKHAAPAQPIAPVAPVAAAPVAPVAHQPAPPVAAAQPVAPVAYQPVAAVQPVAAAQPVAPVAYQPVAAVQPVAAAQPVAPVAYQPVAAVQPAPAPPVAHQPAPPVAAAQPVAPVAYQPVAAVQPAPAPPVAPVAHLPAPPAAPVAYQPVAAVQPAAAAQPVAPVAYQPVAAAQPVAQPAPSLTTYVAPAMPTAPQQSAVPLMSQSGTVRADGWEVLEWPQGSGKWFWKDRNSGRWTAWK